jgi:hypothetical protein
MVRCANFVVTALATVLLIGCQNGGAKTSPANTFTSVAIPRTAHLRTAAEFRAAVGTEGFTNWGHDKNGNDFVSYTAPNGTMAVKSANFADHGVWRLSPDGKVCLKWQKIRDGADTCLTSYVNGNDVYNVLPNGVIVSVSTRQASGNPDHL